MRHRFVSRVLHCVGCLLFTLCGLVLCCVCWLGGADQMIQDGALYSNYPRVRIGDSSPVGSR
jgi:hypothetical protein